jgi:molybdate transport system ATP-binding protein
MSLTAHVVVKRPSFVLDAELALEPGAVVTLLGPNGAGKSTLIAAIAGLLRLDAGRIVLDDTVLAAGNVHMTPQRRKVGVVWQDYLLFPQLSVLENVAFGPRAAGVGRRAARSQARAMLARFGVDDLEWRRPHELSGGQAQRVALARALVVNPQVLLLDEPLAALDAGIRPSVRAELRRHLWAYAGYTIVVTHDPLEALVLGDHVVVLEGGRVVQEGTPADLTKHPRTEYVAELVGLNLMSGVADESGVRTDQATVAVAHPTAGPVHVAFAPAAVTLSLTKPEGSARNAWPGTVTDVEVHGDLVRVTIDGVVPLFADVTPLAIAELDLAPGVRVWASVKASEISVYPV